MFGRMGVWVPILGTLAVLGMGWVALGGEIEETFPQSLHATGAGMRYWYEQPDGMGAMTGIPYDDPRLDCTRCHAHSCDACHGAVDPATGRQGFSVEKAGESETCLPCHERQAVTIALSREQGALDVHLDAGMDCADCHQGAQVHGDGTARRSLHDAGAPRAACTDCHDAAPGASRAHTVHKGKLDCAACHVSNSLACLNCHLDSVIEEGSREGHYFPIMDWTLLVNSGGKVTTGTAFTAVHEGRKFLCYAPYFTHAVRREGRPCEDCHGGKGAKRARSDEPLPMAKYGANKLLSWLGVIPLVPRALVWPFLEKEDGVWMHSTNPDTARVQFVGDVTPITREQLRILSRPLPPEER